jgi:DNA polymerase (family 10)
MEKPDRQATNRDVAERLLFMSQLLEIAGEDTRRIRAYERAAREIDRLSLPVGDLNEEQLVVIPGIGVRIAGNIREIVETGTFQELKDLQATIPASLIELLRVNGVGPQTLRILWTKLGVRTLDDLEKAAHSHRIRVLKGFGAKKEENILRGISQYRRKSGRMARPEADAVLRTILPVFSGDHYAVAGSYRRGVSTVGNLDLLTTEEQEDLIRRLRIVTDAVTTVEEGYASFRVRKAGVDVRFVKPEQWGSALLYFTGSKEFNTGLGERVKMRGYFLNEHGLEDRSSGIFHSFQSEDELFVFLGMEPVPPELRENRGEIGLAFRHALPELVDLPQVRGDLHVHTTWSDGRQTLADVAEAGDARGYEYLVITDHSSRLTPDVLARQQAEIERVNRQHTCQLLAGTEVDIKSDGSLGYPNSVLSDLDFVIASVHSGFGQDEDVLTRRVLTAMENEHVDAVGHPTGRLLGRRPPYAIDLARIVAYAAETGTALEINASPYRLDLDDIYIRQAKEKGVKLAVGTDSHRVMEFSNMRYGITLARRGWCSPADILNTHSLADLLEWVS